MRLDHRDLPEIDGIDGVMAGYNRFLATAYRCADPGDASGDCPRASILMASPDGVQWSILGQLPGSDTGASIWSIYEDERGLFAGGSATSRGTGGVELWWSQDGSSWKSETSQPAFESGACASTSRTEIGGFYRMGDALLAVGSAVWSSVDGQAWQCLGPAPEVLIAGGHDLLVGSGSTEVTSPDDYMWLSGDGATWNQTVQTPTFVRPAAVADGFVALGASFHEGTTALLTSPDGETWAQQPLAFGAQVLQGGPESDGSRAVVVEEAQDFSAESPGDVWVSSTDGSTWSRYPLPRRPSDDARWIAILGDRVVVTGDEQGHGTSDRHELIWTATIA